MVIEFGKILADLGTDEVCIRGRMLRVRALKASEAAKIRDAIPEPTAPTKKDITRGSLAPAVVDESNPLYLRDRAKWSRQVLALEVALAVGLVAAVPSSAEAAVIADRVLDEMTEPEILKLAREVTRLSGGGVAEDREKLRRMLIRDLAEAPAAESDPDLPKEWAETRLMSVLRACERFSIDPRTLDDADPWFVSMLEAFDRVRNQEDFRAADARGSAAGLGI